MRELLKSLFEKTQKTRREIYWREYRQEARSQFLQLKQKGLSIQVLSY